MRYLLKVLNGNHAGAEILLAPGSLTLGAADDCDIVLQDVTLSAPVKFEVTDSAVTLDGNAVELYTEIELGELKLAVGDADTKWPKIKKVEVQVAPADKSVRDPEPAPETRDADTLVREEKATHHGFGCLLWLLLILLLLGAAAFYLYRYQHERTLEYYGKARNYTLQRYDAWRSSQSAAQTPVIPELTVADIASEYNLIYKDGVLSGNLQRRAERGAIIAMARHADPKVVIDLADPETITESVDAALFLIAEGTMKVTKVEGRKVWIGGTSMNEAELTAALREIKDDVAMVDEVDASQVELNVVPAGRAQSAAQEIAAKKPAKAKADKASAPIAGILMVPYPYVVMRHGERVTEGARVGDMTIEKIEQTQVTLRKADGTKVVYRP